MAIVVVKATSQQQGMLLLTLLLSTLSISHALPIPPETGIQVTENLNPQPLQIRNHSLISVEKPIVVLGSV